MVEYRCPCGKTFEPEYDGQVDDYYDCYDEQVFISIWYETCPHCGRELRLTEIYKLTEVEIEEVE